MSHQYEHDDYTHPDVYILGPVQGWAETETDPARISWPERQARAAVPFQVVNGRPVNPSGKTRVRRGRNEMGFWGENLMADALVTFTLRGRRRLLMVERRDGNGWAVPGGHVEPGESPLYAALRELQEETGLKVEMAVLPVADPEESELRDAGYPFRKLAPRYVPDPRSSDEAWAVTIPVHVDLDPAPEGFTLARPGRQLPRVTGRDDARHAAWVTAGSYEDLTAALETPRYGGQVFAAHVPMLRDFLGTETEAGR